MSARPEFEPAAAPVLPATPQRLGKYEIVGLLGEGAMGVVYKAIDPHIHRHVAIKAIRAPLLAPSAQEFGAAQRFRTEAQAAGRLMHPNIVSVYEFGEDGPTRFLVMEHVEGVSLHDLTAHGRRLPLDDVGAVMVQLLDALECAHAQGVWHRDIKPANLLITAEGRLKVTDFGIARIESAALTQHTTVLGSPGYMAPERYTDEAPDSRVDIFACGVLLYELLTGTVPFRGTSSAVMYQVLHQHPPAPSTLPIAFAPPPRLDEVVERALAKRPADRYASAAQMREAFVAAMGRPIVPTVGVGTMVRPRGEAQDTPTQVLPRSRMSAAPGGPTHTGPALSDPTPAWAAPSGPMPSGPTPSGPASTGVPGWDPALLLALERLLVDGLGPVARLVVRNAARRHASPHLAVACIAAEHLDPEEREAFVAAASALLPARTGPRHGSVPTRELPVLGSTPMRPEVLAAAERVLADHIGPIAGLLVRRIAATATSQEQFFTALVDQAGAEADGRRLLAALWKIG
jgi:serine/threonine-protein kinase